MARWIESLVPGSGPPPGDRPIGAYPGEHLGLPRSGVGSAAGFGRRMAALTVDWVLALFIAGWFTGSDPFAPQGSNISWIVLGVWFLLTAAPVAVFGSTPGKVVLGIRVAALGSVMVGVPRALLRTALIALVVPALARDADGRGWQDRATDTVVVRTRG